MIRELFLATMLAATAAVALYGIARVPLYVLASNFQGFLFSIFLFIAAMGYMKHLTS